MCSFLGTRKYSEWWMLYWSIYLILCNSYLVSMVLLLLYLIRKWDVYPVGWEPWFVFPLDYLQLPGGAADCGPVGKDAWKRVSAAHNDSHRSLFIVSLRSPLKCFFKALDILTKCASQTINIEQYVQSTWDGKQRNPSVLTCFESTEMLWMYVTNINTHSESESMFEHSKHTWKGILNVSLLSSFSRAQPTVLNSRFTKWLVTIVCIQTIRVKSLLTGCSNAKIMFLHGRQTKQSNRLKL